MDFHDENKIYLKVHRNFECAKQIKRQQQRKEPNLELKESTSERKLTKSWRQRKKKTLIWSWICHEVPYSLQYTGYFTQTLKHHIKTPLNRDSINRLTIIAKDKCARRKETVRNMGIGLWQSFISQFNLAEHYRFDSLFKDLIEQFRPIYDSLYEIFVILGASILICLLLDVDLKFRNPSLDRYISWRQIYI